MPIDVAGIRGGDEFLHQMGVAAGEDNGRLAAHGFRKLLDQARTKRPVAVEYSA